MEENRKARRRLSAIVRGRVQGVNFRYFTLRCAHELGLTGYVRNKWDGTVEIVAEGDNAALERLLEYIKVGPRAAWVERVDAQWGAYNGQFTRFEVRF